jgi:hypothetical protein
LNGKIIQRHFFDKKENNDKNHYFRKRGKMARTKQTTRPIPSRAQYLSDRKQLQRASMQRAAGVIQGFRRRVVERRRNERQIAADTRAANIRNVYRQYNSATRLQGVARGFLARRRQLRQQRLQNRIDNALGGLQYEEGKDDELAQEEKTAYVDPVMPDMTGGFVFPDDEESPLMVGGVLGQLPAVTNHAFGQITIVSLPTGPLGDNHVPIYNFAVTFRVDDPNVDMNMVQRAALRTLINQEAVFRGNQRYVYGQVRLLRIPIAAMTNDLVTAMCPLNNISDEFEVSLDLFEQSETTLDPRSQSEIEFRYTFVFPEGRQITPDMVRDTTVAFRSMDSRGGNVRINHTNTQARFMAMQAIRGSRASARHIDTPLNLRRRALEQAANDRRRIKDATRTQASILRRNARDLARQTNRVALGLPAVGPPARTPKRSLTDDQRTRYNQKRRERYHEQKDTRGIYQDFKAKIFHHTSLDQYFEHSKAVMVVPNTATEGLCLAMALIRSEQRLYDLAEFQIYESTPESTGSRSFRTFPISDRVKGLLENSRHYSFLCRDDDNTYSGCLFNTFKPMRRNDGEEAKGALKYSLDITNDEIQSWYFIAQGFVEYITESLKDALGELYYDIDPNKEESFLQAVCDVLDIYICVYRAALMGKRCNVYKPQIHDEDIRKNGRHIEVVSIFVSDDHASCITNLREFVKNRASANRMHIQNYCLVCEKVTTANNCNIEACRKHFKECLDKKEGKLVCQSEDMQKKQYIKTYNPPQFTYRSKFKDYVCRTCRMPIERTGSQLDHVCYIVRPEKLDIINEYDIVVYDFEAAQIEVPGMNVKQHDVNLVCSRNAYVHPTLGDDRRHFANIDEFMVWILSQTTKARVYIAHNGGRYDVQFIMRYLEANLIPHSFIPAPSSIHAYLSVTIPFGAGNSATFLDFRNFMPASLKNIGISFGLSITKGDFPHRFNDGWRDLYEGRIPPLNDPRDFWCLDNKRSEEDVTEFYEWYQSQCEIFCTCDDEFCSCGKKAWVFKDQLLFYCWVDVDVLAEAVVKYRDNAMSFGTVSSKEDNCGWEPKSIDPYAHLTIAQMAMKLLLSGLPEPEMITITPNKVRMERSPVAIAWMERIQQMEGNHIRHIGNSNSEYHCLATNRFLDGICRETNTVYVCLNCDFHGCPSCFYTEVQTGADHPLRPGTFGAVYQDTRQFVENLLKTYGSRNVVITWSCEVDDLTEKELELGNIMKERDCFYGGRTEAFAPYTYADPALGRQIKYKDVCSLYPFVCARKRLPTGVPEHICGVHIQLHRLVPDAPDAYFGFVKCQIIPNKEDILGLLPRREESTGRLEFPLEPWIGCFGTEELCLAVRNGYIIGDVYEVYHWSEEESSETLLRGYVSFFLRMKQEAEGWKKLGASSETPTEEEKDRVIEKVFVENGHIARIRKEFMEKNPTKRQLAKIFLNSLWGKFCQKPHKEHFVTIHGYQQFIKLWYDSTIDRSSFSFRHIGNNTWKVLYRTVDSYTKPNPKYNIYLAAKVTEWARTILHTEMLRIGPQNVLYCDTDSIMYECSHAEVCNGHGLGEWVDEYPHDRIVKLYVLAPKFYFLLKENGESLLKSKGVQLTLANTRRINEERLIRQILEVLYPVVDEETGEKAEFESFIEVDNMIIGVNSTNARLPYGCMLTRYTEPKKVRPVYSKRNVVSMPLRARNERPNSLEGVKRVYTIPKGFHLDCDSLVPYLYSF